MASSAVDFYIGLGDKLPWLVVTPQTDAGSNVVPSGGISATIAPVDTKVTTNAPGTAELFTDTDNVVKLRYKWTGAETATAGRYHLQFKDAYGNNDPESFPNNTLILFEVFDQLPGQILTNRADYQAVRDYLGVSDDDLPDGAIESSGFLPVAEAFIVSKLVAQPGYNSTMPTVTQIMAGDTPATPADKAFLKAAVVYQIAYRFAVGETSAVDTSVSVGPITKDLGGIGTQWKDQREEALKDCDQALGSITGFKRWRTL